MLMQKKLDGFPLYLEPSLNFFINPAVNIKNIYNFAEAKDF